MIVILERDESTLRHDLIVCMTVLRQKCVYSITGSMTHPFLLFLSVFGSGFGATAGGSPVLRAAGGVARFAGWVGWSKAEGGRRPLSRLAMPRVWPPCGRAGVDPRCGGLGTGGSGPAW